jgi:hypothetical protein
LLWSGRSHRRPFVGLSVGLTLRYYPGDRG